MTTIIAKIMKPRMEVFNAIMDTEWLELERNRLQLLTGSSVTTEKYLEYTEEFINSLTDEEWVAFHKTTKMGISRKAIAEGIQTNEDMQECIKVAEELAPHMEAISDKALAALAKAGIGMGIEV